MRKGTNSPWCAVLWCYGHLAPVKHILCIPLVKQVAVMRPGRRHDAIRKVNGYSSTPECSFVQTAVHRWCLWCLHVWLMVPKASLCVLHCLRNTAQFLCLLPVCPDDFSLLVRFVCECHKISLQSQFLKISIVRFQCNLNLKNVLENCVSNIEMFQRNDVFCVVIYCMHFLSLNK